MKKIALASVGFAAIAASIIALTGCAAGSTSAVIQALANDTNSVTVKVSSPWGSLDYERNQGNR